MNIDLLFLTCEPRAAAELVDELMERLKEQQCPARVVRYGVMMKAQHGFLLLACPSVSGFPTAFLEAIHQEEEISGYVLVKGDEQPVLGAGETEVPR